MFPKKNIQKFIESNPAPGLTYNEQTHNLDRLIYLQTRLNTDLMLLSNPAILKVMGADKTKLLKEAKDLLNITQMVEIPEPVSEKKRKLF